jgi:Domain of unknown function (DUF397)
MVPGRRAGWWVTIWLVSRLTPQEQPGPLPAWFKSSFSFSNGNCIEVAALPDGGIGVRDSKDPDGPSLTFTPDEWRAFLGGVRNGEFDRFGQP